MNASPAAARNYVTPRSRDGEARTGEPQAEKRRSLDGTARAWRCEPVAGPLSAISLLERALVLAELADLAYFREDVARSLFAEAGFPESTYFEDAGAQAYLVANADDVVVICRGTEVHEWSDVKADLTAWMVLFEGLGRLHRGFSDEVDRLWPRLEAALADNRRTLWFTGHSLGAAMAAICAGRCLVSQLNSVPAGLHTFGSPRVGNRRYVQRVQPAEYCRWVNNNDVVTRCPPIWMGYRHGGRHLYFDSRGRLRRLTKWQRTKDRWRGVWHGIKSGRLDPISDHLMGNYLACLGDAVAAQRRGEDVLGRTERLWSRVARRLQRREAAPP